jgi:hypothetical protein
MSLELAAQHLASRGRKGDSMLVHMAPEEVSGLQALAKAAGGTLTLNPDTGLPEASFLKRMLPMLIGAGITAATGGAAAPWMIGLGLGGLETVRTGSLEKGLMAGLGAYGGAGLAGGLAAAGAGAAAPAMSVAPAAASPAATGLASSLSAGAAAPAMSMAPAVASPAATGLASSLAPTTGTLSAGVKALGTEAGRSAALSSMGGGMGAAKYGLAALSPTLQPDEAKPYDGGGPNPYEFEYDPATQQYTRVPVGTRQRDILAPTTRMAADGGMMSSGPLEAMSNQNRMDTMMANGGQMFARGGEVNLPDGAFVVPARITSEIGNGSTNAGAQRLSAMEQRLLGGTYRPVDLGRYSGGGNLVRGDGDGVSDSVPATIGGKRPARIADGEYIFSPKAVKNVGNGSTEAGARKLYAMLDRVQKARGKTTGKDRVAVNSRTDKLLPA